MKHHAKCVAFIRQVTLILLSHFTIRGIKRKKPEIGDALSCQRMLAFLFHLPDARPAVAQAIS